MCTRQHGVDTRGAEREGGTQSDALDSRNGGNAKLSRQLCPNKQEVQLLHVGVAVVLRGNLSEIYVCFLKDAFAGSCGDFLKGQVS